MDAYVSSLILLLFLLVSASHCVGSHSHLCKTTEREALLQFKSGVRCHGGMLSSWNVEEDCCNWEGITCSNTSGHVLHLHLPGDASFDVFGLMSSGYYYLEGEIHPSIMHLKLLEHLVLSGNSFNRTSIPAFFGSFRNLKHLNLSHRFVGAIPHQLANLSNIQFLDLTSDTFIDDHLGYKYLLSCENCEWLSHLTSLKYLAMSNVDFRRTNNFFGALNTLPSISHIDFSWSALHPLPTYVPHVNFTQLRYLDLSGSHLELRPSHSWLGNITSLEHLDLSHNTILEDASGRIIRNLFSLKTLSFLNCGIDSGMEDIFSGCNCSFPNLVNLDLALNNITGEPITIWSCKRLKRLELRRNKLVGSIPDAIGIMLISLEYLSLSSNHLNGSVPSSIGMLRSLKHLDLSFNSLNGVIPPSIGMLTNLEHIDLSYNNLNGYIPNDILALRNLKHMFLSNNVLDGIVPPDIGMLGYIEYIDLANNYLNGSIPLSIGKLRSCTHLDISNNKLSGEIPETLWELRSLSVLRFAGNSIHGVLTEKHFSNLSKLQRLSLGGHSLDLIVPSRWVPPFRLYYLEISICKVAREFPPWVKTQDGLAILKITGSCVKGVLPSWLWNFSSSLLELNLSMNIMTGEIPDPVGSSIPEYIDLSFNKLKGPLPSFSTVGHLRLLNFNNNSLSGNIVLDNTENLSYLDLSMNKFDGTIPSSICKAQNNIQVLSLSYNQLSGQIPACLWGFRSMSYLRLNNNNLSGNLPKSLKSLTSLFVLDLSYNRISGALPTWITGNNTLLALNLRSNVFSGSIPRHLMNSNNLQILDLSDNKLSGSIPRSFGNFTYSKLTLYHDYGLYESDQVVIIELCVKGQYLQYRKQLKFVTAIDLSGNILSGGIPHELGKLNKLMSLNLSNNLITGSIPDTLSNMSHLESLDLSQNNLSGSIPPAFEKLSYLSDFNVSYNNLSGSIPTRGQFGTYSDTSYIGNPRLCGPPLNNRCSPIVVSDIVKEAKFCYFDMFWLSIGITFGFVLGFWAFWGLLLLVEKWRHTYFNKLVCVCARLLPHLQKS